MKSAPPFGYGTVGFSIGLISTARALQVFAWDTDNNAVDEDEDDGRSFISVLSEVITDDDEDCDGRAKNEMGEGRMDIEDSEMAYLGFYDGESYGLTWKVRRGASAVKAQIARRSLPPFKVEAEGAAVDLRSVEDYNDSGVCTQRTEGRLKVDRILLASSRQMQLSAVSFACE